ncbi:hypothetical protein RYX36_025044, partial [Vicia faba]
MNDFKNVVRHLTGLQSNATKPESEITTLQKIRPQEFHCTELSGPPFHLVDMQWINYVESQSPITPYMRNFQESMMNYHVSRGNQLQSYPLETQ